MTLSPRWLDELRARTTLSAVIAPTVKLIKAGREFKACCPFHHEKTPSFTINDEKGFYHCLAAETRVMTRDGRTRIDALVGRTIDVLTRGGAWVPGSFASYGQQELWEIGLTRNGVEKSIYATSGHRWFVRERQAAVETRDLQPGARLESVFPRAGTGPVVVSEAPPSWTVRHVARTERVEEVFCAEVPGEHAFALEDNILTGNCFGCGAHGDAIRFLTDHRGLPFMDAVKELAGKAGMEVPAPDPREREKSERAAGLHDVMAAAQQWFAQQLAGPEGGEARAYLASRGIEPAAVERFGVGFAPDTRGKLKKALEKLGEDKLVESGMLIQPEEAGRPSYDRFRGRIMFPVRDARGRVIAFGGRILGQGEPKYLNSPDTPLFDKGRTLYNIDRASPASRQAGRLIVVEGYMDVIALDRAGIAEVVAPNGTALTEAQLERMWRLDGQPICCFDGDAAGQKASVRAALRALPHIGAYRTLRFVALPAGKDPDDIVRSGGRDAIEALLQAPEPLVERLWRFELEAHPLDTPEARAGFRQRLVEHTQAIADGSVRQLYRDEWLRRFDELVRPQRQGQPRAAFQRREWKKRDGRFVPPAPPTLESTRGLARSGGVEPPIARALLQGFILYPEALHDHLEELAHLVITDRSSAELRDQLVQIAMKGEHLDRSALQTILAERSAGAEGRRGAMRFSFTQQGSNPQVALGDLGAALEAVIARTEIEAALNEATRRLEQDFSDAAYAEQQRLIAAKKSYNDRLASLASNE